MGVVIVVKVIHITTAILFIGCVYFRTFILPRAKLALDMPRFEAMESALSSRTRMIGKVNNTLLLFSGAYLAYHFFYPSAVLLHLKITLGLIVIGMFFGAPLIMHRFEGIKKQKIKTLYHHTMFALMLCIIVLSQTMFTL